MSGDYYYANEQDFRSTADVACRQELLQMLTYNLTALRDSKSQLSNISPDQRDDYETWRVRAVSFRNRMSSRVSYLQATLAERREERRDITRYEQRFVTAARAVLTDEQLEVVEAAI